jgi:hypothetical protein
VAGDRARILAGNPSATASITPWAIPSWAAPQVIVWWRPVTAVALLTIIVGGQTGSYLD